MNDNEIKSPEKKLSAVVRAQNFGDHDLAVKLLAEIIADLNIKE